MDQLKSITEICKMYHTTSRTLRYYEELGLLRSERMGDNSPRKYSENEVLKLRKILILRSFDLSINEIKELLDEANIIEALKKRKRRLTREVENDIILKKRLKDIYDDNIINDNNCKSNYHTPDGNYDNSITPSNNTCDSSNSLDLLKKVDQDKIIDEYKELAASLTKLIIQKDYSTFKEYFYEAYRNYFTAEYLKACIESTIIESGDMTEDFEIIYYNDRQTNAIIHCTLSDIILKYYFNEEKKLTGIEYLTLE